MIERRPADGNRLGTERLWDGLPIRPTVIGRRPATKIATEDVIVIRDFPSAPGWYYWLEDSKNVLPEDLNY